MEDFSRSQMVDWIRDLQLRICSSLEQFENKSRFSVIEWKRPTEDGTDGGGGWSRILAAGDVFEKAGVNVSVVSGVLPALMKERLRAKSDDFFAAGLSLVIHPKSPQVPTVHANFRFFEQPDRSWFGGGADLTPYVYNPDEFRHFHKVLKDACESKKPGSYAQYKKECDEYFYLPHRNEGRGIGGVFFDYLSQDLPAQFEFVKSCGEAFIPAYAPIVERNYQKAYDERQKKFQLLRRGRYVEFNLVYDRGTLFGLQTKGNSESILMSLPPEVHFDFQPNMELNESERELTSCFRSPRSWV